ncbi:helix-turn-helix domain-containing protein [Dysgonomonas sp. ZJ279]|uniref:helix-turn-helix domain-containing protein n=1 Tax=Dysgonomonas sp. ZJ279 TaxID=2709796 RepID=UPI0013E9A384|nr:helix-turn-helix transcriptional regulator [Dysgonomonas sp. ZJ279]
MEAVAEKKKKINHGRNIRIARTCQNITQEDLAFRVSMSQSKVSALELEEIIEDPVLDKFATALNIPVGFLKNFIPEEAMNIYNQTMSEPTLTNTSAENSNDIVTQQIVGEQENNYNYPINDIKDLYERLLKEKDKQIEELKAKLK